MMNRRGARIFGVVFAVLGLGLLAGCTEEVPEVEVALTPVTVEPAMLATVSEKIEAVGQLLAVEQAEIAAGVQPGTSTADARRIAELVREVRGLRGPVTS